MTPALRMTICLISASLTAVAPAWAGDDRAISGPYCAKVQDVDFSASPACGGAYAAVSAATRPNLYQLMSEQAAGNFSLSAAVATDAAGSSFRESLVRRIMRKAKPACPIVLTSN